MPTLPAKSIQCCVTSPPYYGLRDYGNAAQIGIESSPAAYVEKLVAVFREVWRVLADDGVLWLNLGDTYAGSNRGVMGDGLKPKDLIGIPWRVAFALQDDGWTFRSDIIWAKPNAMPESVTDRPTKAHEYLFLLTKQAKYYYDADAIKEPSTGQTGAAASFKRTTKDHLIPNQSAVQHRNERPETIDTGTRNKRSVWTIATKPYKGAHFATMPPALVEPCILAGSRKGDTILDPFAGSSTVGKVALQYERNYIGIDLNPSYIELSKERIAPLLGA